MATTTILGKEINALSASYASTAQTLLGSVVSASNASTASVAEAVRTNSAGSGTWYPLMQAGASTGYLTPAFSTLFSFNGATGVLNVTSSRAVSSSFATSASYVTGSIFTNENRALSASFAVSSSFAVSASWAPSTGGGSSIYRLTSQTLPSASWVATGSYYTSSFANANITTTTRVDFIPNNDSYTEVTTAGILPQVTVTTGTASFYSLFPPQTNIIGEITIFPTV